MLVVPCPVLVGRATELDALVAGLDAATAGSGRLVFVAGEAGIGKSRLAREVCDRARARGVRVLWGRAVPGSSAPFRPLTEALAPVAAEIEQVEGLGPWLPALSAVLPTLLPAAGGEVTAPMRGEATLRLLATACTGTGGVLLIEDLHWADPETVSVVEHLGDNLERAPVLCLATIRPDEDGPARDLLRRVAARRAPQILRLRHLSEAQVATMVHSCTGGTGSDAVGRVLRLSEGVPFLVEEMLAAPGVPASFAETVTARLAALPAGARQVLVGAAAFGREFDWRLLAPATGLPVTDVVDALDRGVAAQLLAVDGDGFRFRHALTAEAVFHSVIPPRRQAAAAAALAALDATYPEVPAEMRDVAARVAERAGRPERAGALLLAAGEDALGRGALDTAVDALTRACPLLPAGDAQNDAGKRLVEALVLAGRIDDAFEASRSLLGRLDRSSAASLHLGLAGAALTASHWELARAELASTTALVGADSAPALAAELALRQAELAAATGDARVARAQATGALDLARRGDAPGIECEALGALGRLARRTSLDDAARWFREALDVAQRHDLALPRLRATHELGTIALLDRSAVDTLIEAHALAESLGAMATAAILDIEIAAGYASLHDPDAAERHGRRAVRRAGDLGLDVVAAYGWLHVGDAALLRGEHDQRKAAAAAARAAAPGNRDIDGLLVGLDVFTCLLADDIDEALAASERSTALLRGSATAPPAHYRGAWPLLLAVRHRPEAPAALDELEGAGLGAHRGCRGTLRMARAVLTGWTDPRRASVQAVEADADLVGVPLWRCIVRRLAAQAATADGWVVPDAWLTEAERWAGAHGYPALAAACAALAGRRPATVPAAWARLGVTAREADVLALVIEGRANREIAEQLHLSVRTVEKHVEALLRKTQSSSRTQLARVATTG